jgi:uncharacterized protein YbjQ (UPF0145 family)
VDKYYLILDMPLPIFTVQKFNKNTLQPAGAVFAQRVESISIVRNFFAGIAGIAGGRSTMMEKKMNDLTTVLLEELDQQAIKKYPNAVALIDVDIHFSDIGKNDSNMFLAGQASATALIKRTTPITSQPISDNRVSKPVEPISPPEVSDRGQPLAQMAPAQMAPAQMAPAQMAPAPLAPMAKEPVLENSKPQNIFIQKPISGGKSSKLKLKSRKYRK